MSVPKDGFPDEATVRGQAGYITSGPSDGHGILRSGSRATSSTSQSHLGKDKWSSRQSLHFTSSKLSLVKNPVQTDPKKEPDLENVPENETDQSRGDGTGEKDSDIPRLEDIDVEDEDSISFYRVRECSNA